MTPEKPQPKTTTPTDQLRSEPTVQSLTEMRDQLADYLAVIEKNTDAVNNWLAAHEQEIIFSHYALQQAFLKGDSTEALKIVKSMGEVAGFVLGLQDFGAKSEEAFGKFGNKNAVQQAIAAIPTGVPDSLQEILPDLPDVDISSLDVYLPTKKVAAPVAAPAKTEKKSWWKSVDGWKEKTGIVAESLKEGAENVLQGNLDRPDSQYIQMQSLKADILGLQSDRHYYVDSLMDWIGDTLVSDTPEDTAYKMKQYQNPAYVIRLAQEDYHQAVEVKTQVVRDVTLAYSKLAFAIDTQDMQAIKANIGLAYPPVATKESALLQETLLRQFDSASMTELVLKHINDLGDKFELLSAIFSDSPSIIDKNLLAFKGDHSPQWVFDGFLAAVLDNKEPLNPQILSLVLNKLEEKTDVAAILLDEKSGHKNSFQQVVARFADDFQMQREVLSHLLRDSSPLYLTAFAEALSKKDVNDVMGAMKLMAQADKTEPFVALWDLCHPGKSLVQEILLVSENAPEKAKLLDKALDLGILQKINEADQNLTAFGAVMEYSVFPALTEFPLATVRKLMAASFGNAEENSDKKNTFRNDLEMNYLAKIAQSDLSEPQKLQWIAAFLEPFKSDITKAEILHTAASKTADKDSASTLRALEKNLVGDSVRLDENTLLTNLPMIANIWYSAKTQTLRYTTQGQSHGLLENIEPQAANEILSLVQRRGGLIAERGGLFQPENIDQLHFNDKGVTTEWYRADGMLNLDDATEKTLTERSDFVHWERFQSDTNNSYNFSSLCLIEQKPQETYQLIDKYGESSRESRFTNAAFPPSFVKLAKETWLNPDNASVLRLDVEKQTVQFRIEGVGFDKISKEDLFYTVTAQGKTGFKQLQDSLDQSPDIHHLEKSGLYFNMKALSHLVYDEGAGGFYCKRYSSINKAGFIKVEPEVAEEILDVIGAKAGVLRLGNALFHEASIDNAYLTDTKDIQIVVGQEFYKIPKGERYADTALLHLSQLDGFRAILTGDKKQPLDVVNLKRATSIHHDSDYDRTNIIAGDVSYYINLDVKATDALLNSLEQESLQKSHLETQHRVWTQNLKSAILALPAIAAPKPVAAAPSSESELEVAENKADLLALTRRKSASLSQAFSQASSSSLIEEENLRLMKKSQPPKPPKRPKP